MVSMRKSREKSAVVDRSFAVPQTTKFSSTAARKRGGKSSTNQENSRVAACPPNARRTWQAMPSGWCGSQRRRPSKRRVRWNARSSFPIAKKSSQRHQISCDPATLHLMAPSQEEAAGWWIDVHSTFVARMIRS